MKSNFQQYVFPFSEAISLCVKSENLIRVLHKLHKNRMESDDDIRRSSYITAGADLLTFLESSLSLCLKDK